MNDEIIKDFTEEELRVLKEMIERERAVSWFWKWIKNFVFVAVGGTLSILGLYQFVKGS